MIHGHLPQITCPPPRSESQADREPPNYTMRSHDEFVEKTFQLENTKGRSWLWMKVRSRSNETQQLPLFYDHDTISGSVEVDFDMAEGTKAILISVIAGVTAVGQDEIRFLDINRELWNAKTSQVKPKGKQSHPYSITLPDNGVVSEKGKKHSHAFPLPPSFSERASPAYIDYKVVVTIKKSSFRVNQTLATNFMFLPLTRADPPSPLRQLAYREGTPLVGPPGDAAGWKVLSPVNVSGTVFGTRKVDLKCTLALATPLAYALGSPIPITITLQGSDDQALDLLATRSAVHLHLVRVRVVGSHAIHDDADTSGRSNNVFRDSVGSAFFWTSNDGAPELGTRVLQGELEVKKSLKLGFIFPRFSVRYMLVLYQFQAPGFVPAVPAGGEPLISERVVITTANAPGVTPRSFTPPGYVRAEEGDYSTTMGYLENGNQRFLHHHGFS